MSHNDIERFILKYLKYFRNEIYYDELEQKIVE